ncbi:probable pectinesterase/pectinesterase inhibitor 32 [Magnolia sinica]|uniref:probable pectinesterase/pectinesterase inhibitor 32 n=1 Tax=Magnolia sinica TaxID=86752 RepID=UPI00265A1CCF|nr:probable pectinesterase/pectinesterase inhibitor 32 [Magnolia sinica]
MLNVSDRYPRLANAIETCMELMELTAEELRWTQYATSQLNGIGLTDISANVSVGINGDDDFHPHVDHVGNLNAWLSAASTNQDTCLEGLEGTQFRWVYNAFEHGMRRLTESILHALSIARQFDIMSVVPPSNGGDGGRKLLGDYNDFPRWIQVSDRRLLDLPVSQMPVNVTVALDGTGNFTKLTDAIASAPSDSHRRYVIYVKAGVYQEYVRIKKHKRYLVLVGDGADRTIITGNLSVRRNKITTYLTTTFGVTGRGIIIRDMTFKNTAGPKMSQAVAFRSNSDLSVYYRCGFHGYQDTLYAHSLRQFYRNCTISGTVDFIFGNSAAVFQNCKILLRKPLPGQKNTITAHGRLSASQTTGFSFQKCIIAGEPQLLADMKSTKSFLGRPWRPYSTTVFMQSYISDLIHPRGWVEWSGDYALKTLYYAEYKNYGPGARLVGRVNWIGFHSINTTSEMLNFTVDRLLHGSSWLPFTGVTYSLGLQT